MSRSDLKSWLRSKRLVVIHWIDAASSDEWHDPSREDEAQECISCGILLSESETTITLTHTFGVLEGKDCDTCCTLSIPKGCIVDLYEAPELTNILKQVKGRKPRCKKQSQQS